MTGSGPRRGRVACDRARDARTGPYAPRGLRLAVCVLLGACATADPPPGGEQDDTPPVVIAVTPEPGSVLGDLRAWAEFAFDERISEQRIEASVLVSPRTGDFRVEKGGREIRVRQAGGWSPGVVYRVTLLPGVADLFGNARTQPAELVFSTGPDIPPTVLGGVVTDRMTGAPVVGAAVTAVAAGDTVPYVAIADAEGFFALRFLPPGSYLLRGLRDGNGDWRVGPFEPRDERIVDLAAGDTLVEPLALLAPDTTAATLVRVEVVDSTILRLGFDDALAPEDLQEDMAVRVIGTADAHEPQATPIAPHLLQAALAAEFAPDSAAGEGDAGGPGADPGGLAEDSARAEAGDQADEGPLLGAAVDSVPPAEAVDAGPPPTARAAGPPTIEVPRGPDGAPLPTREWYVRLAAPLRPGVTYRVLVSGVRNVNGLGPGGGEAEVTAPVPEPEEPAGDGQGDADEPGEEQRGPEADRNGLEPDGTAGRAEPPAGA